MAIDQEPLAMLACPKCTGEVQPTPEGDGLVRQTCQFEYPINDDIPVMLIDEAIRFS